MISSERLGTFGNFFSTSYTHGPQAKLGSRQVHYRYTYMNSYITGTHASSETDTALSALTRPSSGPEIIREFGAAVEYWLQGLFRCRHPYDMPELELHVPIKCSSSSTFHSPFPRVYLAQSRRPHFAPCRPQPFEPRPLPPTSPASPTPHLTSYS